MYRNLYSFLFFVTFQKIEIEKVEFFNTKKTRFCYQTNDTTLCFHFATMAPEHIHNSGNCPICTVHLPSNDEIYFCGCGEGFCDRECLYEHGRREHFNEDMIEIVWPDGTDERMAILAEDSDDEDSDDESSDDEETSEEPEEEPNVVAVAEVERNTGCLHCGRELREPHLEYGLMSDGQPIMVNTRDHITLNDDDIYCGENCVRAADEAHSPPPIDVGDSPIAITSRESLRQCFHCQSVINPNNAEEMSSSTILMGEDGTLVGSIWFCKDDCYSECILNCAGCDRRVGIYDRRGGAGSVSIDRCCPSECDEDGIRWCEICWMAYQHQQAQQVPVPINMVPLPIFSSVDARIEIANRHNHVAPFIQCSLCHSEFTENCEENMINNKGSFCGENCFRAFCSRDGVPLPILGPPIV